MTGQSCLATRALGTLVSDAGLLETFATGRGDAPAEAAFATLVDRHGPLRGSSCRRVTRDPHTADDAFQAVFLVLARKAHMLRLESNDSLGRWLYAVSLRVARQARTAATVRRHHFAKSLDGLEPVDSSSSFDPCERADLRAAIDAEIARLPARYRSAVVLCYLEGLPQEQAARRLRCPVGTVQSRLQRARERLRSGLARRGLAPAVGALVAALESTSRAAVPPNLAKSSAAAAVKISSSQAFARAAPAAVARLAGLTLRQMLMKQYWTIAGSIALGLATTSGAVALALARGDEPRTAPHSQDLKPVAGTKPPGPSLAEKLDRLKADYENADRAFHSFYRGSYIPKENLEKALQVRPDLPALVRRVADLAAASPTDPAVRDAMLWVIRQAGGADDGPFGGEFAIAANWLLRNHGDDPDAVRVALELDNAPSLNRDTLLLGFYASAKCRESKGLARLALAQYLEHKAMWASRARGLKGRQTITHVGVIGEDGKIFDLKQEQPDGQYAYFLHLQQCDADYLRTESGRLYAEVIDEYADVPYVTAHDRRLEALLNEPAPKWSGEPLTKEARRKIEERLARRQTLGQVAEARLDDLHNLAVGKAAPEIKGTDIHGKPLALSDYRGKVVAIVFWGTWCGPCMREIPREKALVERMKGRPFAMLGVNADADAAVARKVMEEKGVTWPNWHDGSPGEGPIAMLYHVQGYPTIYVIDAAGKIRSKKAQGDSLDQLVEKLVAEHEAKIRSARESCQPVITPRPQPTAAPPAHRYSPGFFPLCSARAPPALCVRHSRSTGCALPGTHKAARRIHTIRQFARHPPRPPTAHRGTRETG